MAVLNNLFKIIHSKFAFFKSKLRFFVKILMKFCRNFTNMLRMSRIFNFLKKKDPIFGKIRENFGNVQIIQKIIQNYSVVSLAVPRAPCPSAKLLQLAPKCTPVDGHEKTCCCAQPRSPSARDHEMLTAFLEPKCGVEFPSQKSL